MTVFIVKLIFAAKRPTKRESVLPLHSPTLKSRIYFHLLRTATVIEKPLVVRNDDLADTLPIAGNHVHAAGLLAFGARRIILVERIETEADERLRDLFRESENVLVFLHGDTVLAVGPCTDTECLLDDEHVGSAPCTVPIPGLPLAVTLANRVARARWEFGSDCREGPIEMALRRNEGDFVALLVRTRLFDCPRPVEANVGKVEHVGLPLVVEPPHARFRCFRHGSDSVRETIRRFRNRQFRECRRLHQVNFRPT